jgi:hypothetical protein
MAAAESALRVAKETTSALRDALKDAGQQLEFRKSRVFEAARAVLVADSAAAGVLAEFQRVKVRFVQLLDAVAYLEDRSILPPLSSNWRERDSSATFYLEQWEAAARGLEENPDLILPKV